MESHITFRKIRKTVHKIMLKYGKKEFYRKIDWIEKVLKQMRVKPSSNIKARIRNHIDKWLRDNSEILDIKTDNKKEILDSKFTADSTDNKDQSTEKKNEGNNNSNNLENQWQAQVQEQVSASKPNSSNQISIPPMPEAVPIKKLKEKISVIDLTSEDEKKVKKNVVEVITIDDDIEIIDEKVFPHQPLVNLPEQHYALPDYSYYDYYRNDYFFYPVIVQPHSANY